MDAHLNLGAEQSVKNGTTVTFSRWSELRCNLLDALSIWCVYNQMPDYLTNIEVKFCTQLKIKLVLTLYLRLRRLHRVSAVSTLRRSCLDTGQWQR